MSAVDSNGRTIWIADAHRDNEKRFVEHAEEKLTAFMEQESAIRAGQSVKNQSTTRSVATCRAVSSEAHGYPNLILRYNRQNSRASLVLPF